MPSPGSIRLLPSPLSSLPRIAIVAVLALAGACGGGSGGGTDTPSGPGVRLVRPMPDSIVGLVFDAELEVRGPSESAALELYKGVGSTMPVRTYACKGSCTTAFTGSAGDYEVRGWAVIDGQRYETPRARVTLDPTPFLLIRSRLRATDEIELTFNKPVAATTIDAGVKATRRFLIDGRPEHDDVAAVAVRSSLESGGKVLVVRGSFGAPATVQLALDLKDAGDGWSLQRMVELTQSYLADVVEVDRNVTRGERVLVDKDSRPIVVWSNMGRHIARREPDGRFTDLLPADPIGDCLRDQFSAFAIDADATGRLVAVCGITAQPVAFDGTRWTALGPALVRRVGGVSVGFDAKNRAVVTAIANEAGQGGQGYDDRVTLTRYDGNGATSLSTRLNAADKHLVISAVVITGGGDPIVAWEEGNVQAGSTAHAVRVTDGGLVPVPWPADLRPTPWRTADGKGGAWMIGEQIGTNVGAVLRVSSGGADAPYRAGTPEVPVLFRDQDGALAIFGRRMEKVGSSLTDPGDPNSGSTPIVAVMMTLQRFDGTKLGKLPGLASEILERSIATPRIVVDAARAPDGSLFALVARGWIDTSTTPFTAREDVWLARRAP